jgi:pimeloyl-ACP methyl ester carboxylesterase
LHYPPVGPAKGRLIVAGATGVPQRFYAAFARFAANQGIAVWTLDYRGVGSSRPPSLRGFRMDYLDWARLDLAALLDHVAAQVGGPIWMVGHSYGGHAFGLLPGHERIERLATFATGARATQGLSGPTGQVLRRGSPVSFNICHWGANICRAGWLASGPDDLPEAARGYLDAFAGPYLEGLSDWFGLMRPGVSGGAVWQRVTACLPRDTFGIELNPGHLIGLDEWISSPIFDGSDLPLRSGMAMQCDVIPSHAVFGSTRMEDGYVIADAALQADLAARFPDVAARCAVRARFMRDVIGLDVPETLLPLADTCGVIAPYLFDPGLVMTLR